MIKRLVFGLVCLYGPGFCSAELLDVSSTDFDKNSFEYFLVKSIENFEKNKKISGIGLGVSAGTFFVSTIALFAFFCHAESYHSVGAVGPVRLGTRAYSPSFSDYFSSSTSFKFGCGSAGVMAASVLGMIGFGVWMARHTDKRKNQKFLEAAFKAASSGLTVQPLIRKFVNDTLASQSLQRLKENSRFCKAFGVNVLALLNVIKKYGRSLEDRGKIDLIRNELIQILRKEMEFLIEFAEDVKSGHFHEESEYNALDSKIRYLAYMLSTLGYIFAFASGPGNIKFEILDEIDIKERLESMKFIDPRDGRSYKYQLPRINYHDEVKGHGPHGEPLYQRVASVASLGMRIYDVPPFGVVQS